MDIYFAGAENALKELKAASVEKILITLANGIRQIPKVPHVFGDKYKLIIDSGAFTFQRTGGMSVELWILKMINYKKYGTEIIGLDVIGDAEASYQNYIEIIKHFEVMPTFHVGSDIKYLKKYLETTDRMAIGGMVGYKSKIHKLRSYLDEIFALFTPSNLPRFHAFGYLSQQILENYPFYSADATTWLNYGKFAEMHKFEKLKYQRIKSMRVETPDVRGTDLKYLTIMRTDDALGRLKTIFEATREYESYLQKLWQKRGVTWEQ